MFPRSVPWVLTPVRSSSRSSRRRMFRGPALVLLVASVMVWRPRIDQPYFGDSASGARPGRSQCSYSPRRCDRAAVTPICDIDEPAGAADQRPALLIGGCAVVDPYRTPSANSPNRQRALAEPRPGILAEKGPNAGRISASIHRSAIGLAATAVTEQGESPCARLGRKGSFVLAPVRPDPGDRVVANSLTRGQVT